ncbi:MAG: AAA family ATPase [Anaerolineae bacterium]|nr:AAA family ATPase [Anaerolineae bacterium]
MLTKLKIRNFKRFSEAEIELGDAVVFVGPNNSGKTSALQALALWDLGLKTWLARRQGSTAQQRSRVTINRRDLLAVPVPDADLLWRGLTTRIGQRRSDKNVTQPVRIEISVTGETGGTVWECGLEFDYANPESFYCRPLSLANGTRMPVPEQAAQVTTAFLPPMSGLASVEPKVDSGRINVLIGEGQTAQVLRNLCYQLYTEHSDDWQALVATIESYFSVTLQPPEYLPERGEIRMAYTEGTRKPLDISASGRGLQQVLLLLAYLYTHSNAVLLLDEPDAHLEVIRQRDIYKLLTETARARKSQVLIASHSEVLLDEAASSGIVIAFLGKQPRRLNNIAQLRKALKDIRAVDYYQAARKGWVLYVEGATDLSILRAWARRLNHPVQTHLEDVFVHYIQSNKPSTAQDHFYGLREAYPDLLGVALFDRLDKPLSDRLPLRMLMWQRREIENYLCSRETLLAFARANPPDATEPLLVEQRLQVMQREIERLEQALATLGKPNPRSPDIKATDEFLDPLFENYYRALGLSNYMRKANYHVLADYVPLDEIVPEVCEKLDAILDVASRAKPDLE